MPGPTNREHQKCIGVKMLSLGTNYSFYCLECWSGSISESELQATEKTRRLSDVLPTLIKNDINSF